jgi:DNA-binding beta-propeller fold protein YncE
MAFEILGYVDLAAENNGWSLELDKINQFLYTMDHTTYSNSPRIRKIRCSDMTIIDTLTTSFNGSQRTDVQRIDEDRGFLYVTCAIQKYLLKINLSTFSEVTKITLSYGPKSIGMSIDLVNNLGYIENYCTGSVENFIKINLDAMTYSTGSNFTSSGCNYYGGAFHDGHSYFGKDPSSVTNNIIKLDTSPYLVANCTLNGTSEGGMQSRIAVDTIRNFLYVLVYTYDPTYGGELFKIDLSTFTVVDQVIIDTGALELYAYGLVYDESSQLAYIPCSDYNANAQIYIVNCATMTVLETTLSLPRNGAIGMGVLDTNCFYLCQQQAGVSGRVWKIGLYSAPISSILMYKFRPVVLV